MSGYLIDTNVISLFAPGRPPVAEPLREWMVANGEGRLFISAITVAEIRRGIRKLDRKGSTAKANTLEQWLTGLILEFEDRIIPVGTETALVAGELGDEAEARGSNPGFADILIAACARSNDLTVVTLNSKHFQHLGIAVQLPPE